MVITVVISLSCLRGCLSALETSLETSLFIEWAPDLRSIVPNYLQNTITSLEVQRKLPLPMFAQNKTAGILFGVYLCQEIAFFGNVVVVDCLLS